MEELCSREEKMKGLANSVALVVGAACGDDATLPADTDSYTAVAWGANVIPVRPPADTSARASFVFNTATLAYSYSVAVPPPGTIDSIALYQVGAGGVLPASATAILCAGAAACAATSGVGTVVPPATSSHDWKLDSCLRHPGGVLYDNGSEGRRWRHAWDDVHRLVEWRRGGRERPGGSSERDAVVPHHHQRLAPDEPELVAQTPVASHVDRAAHQHVPGIGDLLVEAVVHHRGIEPR